MPATTLVEQLEVILDDGVTAHDLSLLVKSLDTSREKEVQSRTSVCHLHEQHDPGVEVLSASLVMFQDFSGLADTTHFVFKPLSRSGANCTLKWKPNKDLATGPNNKQQVLPVFVQEYDQPQEFGAEQMANITFGIRGDLTEVTS